MSPDKRVETRAPKTRFNSRDRSKETRATSISRLKSFPAEKIKKLDDPSAFSPEPISVPIVPRDPQEVFVRASSSIGINCDRCDATSSELSPVHQQFKPPRTPATNQQQVSPNHQQTDQTNPQCDRSSERQARRSLAASAHQEALVRDRSPRNPSATISQQVIVQHPSTRGTKRAFEPSSCAAIEQNRDEILAFDDEEQPVGGRNAVNYKKAIIQMQKQQQDANNCQGLHLQGTREASSRHPLPESRQSICQQPQHDIYHQQMSQTLNHAASIAKQQQQVCNSPGTGCSYQNQRLSAAQLAPAQGMTSPQDMTMNQMKLTRHNLPVYQQNLGCPVGQGAWPPDSRWTGHNQQYSCQQQAPPPQCGCYYQDAQNIGRQNPEDQDQRVPTRNQTNCKIAAEQQAIKEAHGRQDDNKRKLQFTPDMIRDQELLVSVMRQQGVPHDVMRRQFDALLNEQRRHLAYVAQFQQQTDAPEMKRTCQLVRRTRTENDEKPEWMVHITPPRISCSDLERMKLQQRASNEQQPTNDQSPREAGRALSTQQDYCPQQQRVETIASAVSPQRVYLQMRPHQWQQQVDWSRRGDRTPCGFMGCYPYGHQRSALNNFYHQPSFNGFDQSQLSFYQCPYSTPHYTANPTHSYQAHPEHQKVWPEEHNTTSPNPIDKRGASIDEPSRRPTEPSSLLKMRVYKEVIRPQKRNNGLQDPDTIQRALETLKDPSSTKGLEYLANLAKKKPTIRLNGTQEADEVPEELQRPVSLENTSWVPKRVSANGLENKRNPDNPALCVSRPSRLDEFAMMEYPRQKQSPKTCAAAETTANGVAAAGSQQRDHPAVVSHVRDAGSIPCDQANLARACPANNAVILPYEGALDYQQMQRCCHSRQRLASHNGGQGDGIASIQRPNAPDATGIDRAGGDALGESSEGTTKRRSGEQSMLGTCSYGRPEIREARTIDCAAAHLPARKPDYAPNNLAVSQDKLLASRFMQPPMIF